MTSLQIALLGPFLVEYDGAPMRRFRTRAAQALLAYLTCEAAAPPKKREFLMQFLWPDQPRRAAGVNLRQALYQLRRTIPRVESKAGAPVPLIVADRTTVSIHPDAVFGLDVTRFQALLAGAEPAAAAALYRGPFLADFYLPDSAPFESWAGGWRAALEREALQVLEQLAGEALGRGDGRAAIDWALRQLEIDELREQAHRQLIHGLAQRGERSAALAQYDSCRTLLAQELGVAPSLETETLVARVRDDDPALRREAAPPAVSGDSGPQAADEAPLSRDQRRRLLLLDKVRRFWIEGVLTHTLAGEPPLLLRGETVPEAVTPGWRDVVAAAWMMERSHMSDGALLDLFSFAGGSMLLLGEPGAGKSVTLLRLGRLLLDRAAVEPAAPIPVVLNLISWAERQQSLADWVVAELAVRYHVPPSIGAAWLADDGLLLLLDGYDQVPARLRARCGAVINAFRHNHGFVNVVVCSRTAPFRSSGVRLDLGVAIRLAPLEEQRLAHYLTAEVDEAALWSRLAQAPALLNLARTPLLLHLLRRLHADRPVLTEQLAADDSATADQALLAAYVSHQLDQPPPEGSQQPLRRGLRWLARQLHQHNQGQLQLEQLQPSWLGTPGLRHLFLLVAWLGEGGVLGVILWLLMGQFRLINPTLPAGPSGHLAATLGIQQSPAELLWLLGLNFFLGAAVAGFHVVWRRHVPAAPAGAAGSWQRRRLVGAVALLAGLLTLLAYLPFGDLPLALFWAAGEALLFLVFQYLNHGDSYRREVRTVAAVTWSWRRAGQGVLVALLAVLVAEVAEYWYAGFNGVLRTTVAYGTTGLLLGGLSGKRIEATDYPNQGIRLSLRNGLLAMAAAAPFFGLLSRVLWGSGSPRYMVPLFALGVFWLYGGGNVARHWLVRGLLRRDRQLQLPLLRLLEYGVARGLLRPVGGGYMFIHQALQAYFAAADGAAVRPPTPEVAPRQSPAVAD